MNGALKGTLGIAGTFQFRDKHGNVISTMVIKDSVPLDRLIESEQNQPTEDMNHGSDHR